MADVYRLTSLRNDPRNTRLRDTSGKDVYIVDTNKDLTIVTVDDPTVKEGRRTRALLRWKGHAVIDIQFEAEPIPIDDILVPAFSEDGDKGLVKAFTTEGKTYEWHMEPSVSELRAIPSKAPIVRAHGMIRHIVHKTEEPFIEIQHGYLHMLDAIILTWIIMESHHQVVEHQGGLKRALEISKQALEISSAILDVTQLASEVGTNN